MVIVACEPAEVQQLLISSSNVPIVKLSSWLRRGVMRRHSAFSAPPFGAVAQRGQEWRLWQIVLVPSTACGHWLSGYDFSPYLALCLKSPARGHIERISRTLTHPILLKTLSGTLRGHFVIGLANHSVGMLGAERWQVKRGEGSV